MRLTLVTLKKLSSVCLTRQGHLISDIAVGKLTRLCPHLLGSPTVFIPTLKRNQPLQVVSFRLINRIGALFQLMFSQPEAGGLNLK